VTLRISEIGEIYTVIVGIKIEKYYILARKIDWFIVQPLALYGVRTINLTGFPRVGENIFLDLWLGVYTKNQCK
jgi:hypothetical protein